MKLNYYQTLIFDCDGVILDSNKIKTQAFYQSALSYGHTAAQNLVEYHIQNGGISRYRKFEYFLKNIVDTSIESNQLDTLLTNYATYVQQELMTCTIAPGLQELRQAFPNTRWLVVSGSDQAELRDVLNKRNISHLFDGGIFGSPDSKEEILLREKERGNIKTPALFLGDSRYDYIAATASGIDFVFIHGWSEMGNWIQFCRDLHIISCKNISFVQSHLI